MTLGRPEPLPGLSPASDSAEATPVRLGRIQGRGSPRGTSVIGGDAPALAGPETLLAEKEPRAGRRPRGPALESAPPGASCIAGSIHCRPSSPWPASQTASLPPVWSALPRTGRRPSKDDAKLILAQAVAKLDALDAYQVKMQRRERVGGSVLPEEEVVLSVRRKPKAVRLEWADGSSKGREVIYSPALDAKMIYVHQPATAAVVPSMKIAVDSPLVMKNSRHTIAEAGFEMILANLQKSKRRRRARQGRGREPRLQGARKGRGRRRGLPSFRPPHGLGRNLERLPRSPVAAAPAGSR